MAHLFCNYYSIRNYYHDAHVALENLHARIRKRRNSIYGLYYWRCNLYYWIIWSTVSGIIMKQFTLGPGEHIIAIFRKHPFTLWISGISYGFMLIAPIIFLPFLSLDPITLGWVGILYWVYALVLWTSFFIHWTDFMLDVWILTNERLVDVEQLGLFSRRISTLSLDRVQDVTVQATGLIDTFLKIGTVYVQTAGQEREFKIPSARDPEKIKELIVAGYQEDKDKVFRKIADLR
jgi:hypothetical protein